LLAKILPVEKGDGRGMRAGGNRRSRAQKGHLLVDWVSGNICFHKSFHKEPDTLYIKIEVSLHICKKRDCI
jgi:hypothetical protein